MIPPLLRTPLSGNHPKPVLRPRINSRSEQYTVYRFRAPLTLCSPCDVFILLALSCIYCFFPPLLLSGSPDDRCRCPCDRLRRRRPCTPTVELPGKQSHFPSPSYRLLFYIYLLH